MLPDLKAVKRELQRVHIALIEALAHRRLGVFGTVQRHRIHEGSEMAVSRADGTFEDSEIFTAQAELSIPISSAHSMTATQRFELLDGLASQMAREISRGMFSRLDETLQKTGQVIDNEGRRIGPETILAALESIELEFDQDGAMKNISWVAGPSAKPLIEQAYAEIKRTPELLERFEAILAFKRERCRDREASRKLVG